MWRRLPQLADRNRQAQPAGRFNRGVTFGVVCDDVAGCAIVSGPPALICSSNRGTTLPFLASTFPKRTVSNDVRLPRNTQSRTCWAYPPIVSTSTDRPSTARK